MRGVKQMSIDVDGFDPDELDHSPPSSANDFDASDLPNVLIIANVDDSVFDSAQAKVSCCIYLFIPYIYCASICTAICLYRIYSLLLVIRN